MRQVPQLPPGREAQRAAAYLAEELLAEGFDGDVHLAVDEVGPFIARVLEAAGWSSEPAVPVAFDIGTAEEVSGWAGEEGLHLHPLLVDRWKVLHELAHFLDLRDGHEPTFCRRLLELVEHGVSTEAAEALAALYAECGAEVAPPLA